MKNTFREGDFKKGGVNTSRPDPLKRPYPFAQSIKKIESPVGFAEQEWANKVLMISNELFESLIATIEKQAEIIERLAKENK